MACLAAAPAVSETLPEVITKVYDSSPLLRAQREQLKAITEDYVQARQGWRPTVSISSTASSRTDQPDPFALNPVNVSTGGLTLSQPLYTGGRTLAAIEKARRTVTAAGETLRGTEQTVIQSAVAAYVDVRRDQRLVEISRGNVEVIRAQLDQAKAQFQRGDVTKTDVAQAQSRLSSAMAIASVRAAQLGISRASFNAVAGYYPGDLDPEPSLTEALPAAVDDAFAEAEDANPAVKAARETSRSSRAALAEARAERRPKVTLQASVGFSSSENGGASPFHDYSRTVSEAVNVSMPIFAGGTINSNIRRKIHSNNSDEILVESNRRQAVLLVSQAWNQLATASASKAAYAEQVQSAMSVVEGVKQEQKAGFRTTLDILNAQLELRDAQTSLAQVSRDEYVAQAALLAAMGRLNVEAFSAGVSRPGVDKSLKRATYRGGWVPWEAAVGILDHVGAPSLGSKPGE